MDKPSDRVIPAINGLVMAGGRSRRLGRDKAAIRLDGETLLSRLYRLLAGCCEQVFVSASAAQADDPTRLPFPLLLDPAGDLGPAGGLIAAFEFDDTVAWFVVACDLARLDSATVTALRAARRPGFAATAFRNPQSGLPEPLCAIWEPATLGLFAEHVQSGEYKGLVRFLARQAVWLVDPLDAKTLTNINYPDQLENLSGSNTEP